MRVLSHKRRVKLTHVRLSGVPLHVWLTRSDLLIIEHGDALRDVAEAIRRVLPFTPQTALRYSAFLFAMGERAQRREWSAPWTRSELRAEPTRRYSARTTKAVAAMNGTASTKRRKKPR